jgi:hypothetical protein
VSQLAVFVQRLSPVPVHVCALATEFAATRAKVAIAKVRKEPKLIVIIRLFIQCYFEARNL